MLYCKLLVRAGSQPAKLTAAVDCLQGGRDLINGIHHCIPKRNTYYFERLFPVPYVESYFRGPTRPRLPRRNYEYKLIENTDIKPAGEMEVILATDLKGFGLEGDIVKVSKVLARTHMLPTGVATYVTDENLEKFASIRKEREGEKRQTLSALRTMKQLAAMTLPIPVNSGIMKSESAAKNIENEVKEIKSEEKNSEDDGWHLTKAFVRIAFRNQGVVVDEKSITLPETKIRKYGSYHIQVTVNGFESVPVKIYVYPYSKTTVVAVPPVWSSNKADTALDIDRLVADAAHKMRGKLKNQTSV